MARTRRKTYRNPSFRYGEIVKAGNTLGVYIGEHSKKAQSKIAISYKPMQDTIEVRYVPHVRISPTTAQPGASLRQVLSWLNDHPEARGAAYAAKNTYLKEGGGETFRQKQAAIERRHGRLPGWGDAGEGVRALSQQGRMVRELNLRQEDRYKENPRANFWSTNTMHYGDAEQVSSFATRSGNRAYVYKSGKSFVLQIYSPASRTIQQVTRYKTLEAAERAGLRRNPRRGATGNPGKVLREGEMLIHAGHAIQREGSRFVVRPYGRSFTKLATAKAWIGRHVKREMTTPTRNPAHAGRARKNGKGRPRGQVYRGLRILSCGGVYIVEAYKEPFKTAAEARGWIDNQLGAPVRRSKSPKTIEAANRPFFPLSLVSNPRR